jgi:hypothetical protein
VPVATEAVRHRPQVAGLPGGGFVATWMSDHQRLRAAWIDAAGTPGPPLDVTRVVSGRWAVAVDPVDREVYVAELSRRPQLLQAAPGGTFTALALPADARFTFPEQMQLAVRGGQALLYAPDAAFAGPPGALARVPLGPHTLVDAAAVLPDGGDVLILDTIHGRLRRGTRTSIDAVRRAPDGTLGPPTALATGRLGGRQIGATWCVPWGAGAAATVAQGTRERVVELDAAAHPVGSVAFPPRTGITLRGGPTGAVVAIGHGRQPSAVRIDAYGLVASQPLPATVSHLDAAVDEQGAAVLLGSTPDGDWQSTLATPGQPFGPYERVAPDELPLEMSAGAAAGVAVAIYDDDAQQHLNLRTAAL